MKRFALFVVFFLFALRVFAQYDYEDEDLKKRKPDTHKPTENSNPSSTNPQAPKKKFDRNKLYLGGGLGLSFGNVIYLDVSPTAVYRFHKRFALGAGPRYIYINYRDYPKPYNQTSIYGGTVFPRVFVWEELFAQLQYEVINGEVTYVDVTTGRPVGKVRETFHSLLIGAGYNIPMGENSYFTIMGSTNLTKYLDYDPLSYFFVSFGFGIGL